MKPKGLRGKGSKSSGKSSSASTRSKRDKKRRERSAQGSEDTDTPNGENSKENQEEDNRDEKEQKEKKKVYPIAPDGYIPNSVIRQTLKPKEKPKLKEEEEPWKLPSGWTISRMQPGQNSDDLKDYLREVLSATRMAREATIVQELRTIQEKREEEIEKQVERLKEKRTKNFGRQKHITAYARLTHRESSLTTGVSLEEDDDKDDDTTTSRSMFASRSSAKRVLSHADRSNTVTSLTRESTRLTSTPVSSSHPEKTIEDSLADWISPEPKPISPIPPPPIQTPIDLDVRTNRSAASDVSDIRRPPSQASIKEVSRRNTPSRQSTIEKLPPIHQHESPVSRSLIDIILDEPWMASHQGDRTVGDVITTFVSIMDDITTKEHAAMCDYTLRLKSEIGMTEGDRSTVIDRFSSQLQITSDETIQSNDARVLKGFGVNADAILQRMREPQRVTPSVTPITTAEQTIDVYEDDNSESEATRTEQNLIVGEALPDIEEVSGSPGGQTEVEVGICASMNLKEEDEGNENLKDSTEAQIKMGVQKEDSSASVDEGIEKNYEERVSNEIESNDIIVEEQEFHNEDSKLEDIQEMTEIEETEIETEGETKEPEENKNGDEYAKSLPDNESDRDMIDEREIDRIINEVEVENSDEYGAKKDTAVDVNVRENGEKLDEMETTGQPAKIENEKADEDNFGEYDYEDDEQERFKQLESVQIPEVLQQEEGEEDEGEEEEEGSHSEEEHEREDRPEHESEIDDEGLQHTEQENNLQPRYNYFSEDSGIDQEEPQTPLGPPDLSSRVSDLNPSYGTDFWGRKYDRTGTNPSLKMRGKPSLSTVRSLDHIPVPADYLDELPEHWKSFLDPFPDSDTSRKLPPISQKSRTNVNQEEDPFDLKRRPGTSPVSRPNPPSGEQMTRATSGFAGIYAQCPRYLSHNHIPMPRTNHYTRSPTELFSKKESLANSRRSTVLTRSKSRPDIATKSATTSSSVIESSVSLHTEKADSFHCDYVRLVSLGLHRHVSVSRYLSNKKTVECLADLSMPLQPPRTSLSLGNLKCI